MTAPGRAAWRNRLLSVAIAAGHCGVMLALFPDADRRASFHYAFVLTLGYGHLVGGAVLGRRRPAGLAAALAMAPALGRLSGAARRALGASLALVLVLLLHAAYRAALLDWPLLPLALLAVASWHTVENDLALPGTYRNGLRPPPVAREREAHWAALGITALLLGAAGATLAGSADHAPLLAASGSLLGGPEDTLLALRCFAAAAGGALLLAPAERRRQGLGLGLVVTSALDPAWLPAHSPLAFGDVFALSTLYHLASWWILSWEKRRRGPAAPGSGFELLAVHALPALLVVATFALPGSLGSRVREAFFAPSTYLFWSVLHVMQTARGRRIRANRPLPTR